jgi:hypothetical protein
MLSVSQYTSAVCRNDGVDRGCASGKRGGRSIKRSKGPGTECHAPARDRSGGGRNIRIGVLVEGRVGWGKVCVCVALALS